MSPCRLLAKTGSIISAIWSFRIKHWITKKIAKSYYLIIALLPTTLLLITEFSWEREIFWKTNWAISFQKVLVDQISGNNQTWGELEFLRKFLATPDPTFSENEWRLTYTCRVVLGLIKVTWIFSRKNWGLSLKWILNNEGGPCLLNRNYFKRYVRRAYIEMCAL